MASRYWVGGAGTWDGLSTTHWAATSGGVVGASVPTAADDVFFDANCGGGIVQFAATGCVCRSLDGTGAVATTFQWNSAGILTVGDASGGSLKLVNNIAMNSSGGTAAINFVSTSNNGGAGWGVTTSGKTTPGMNFNGAGGKWVLQDALSISGRTVTLTQGTLDTNSKSITADSFNSNNTNARTLTMGSTAWTLGLVGTAWSFSIVGMTVTANTATVTLTAAGATAGLGSGNYNGTKFVFTGSGVVTFSGSGTTVGGLTRTGTAIKTDGIQFTGNITITGTITLGGNTTQGVNRLLVMSNSMGVQRILNLSGAAVVINGDVIFRDIDITGSPSWTNTGSAFVGDALGNGSLITTNRTTPTTQTYNGTATDNWSNPARWTSRVPLPQDDVRVIAITAGTLNLDMPQIGANIDFTGSTRPAQTNLPVFMYGNLLLASGMTTASGSTMNFCGRGSQTITTLGVVVTWTCVVDAVTGTYTLQDSFNNSRNANNTIDVQSGTLADNGQSVTLTGAASTVRCFAGATMSISGVWSIGLTSAATVWSMSGTLIGSGSTIILTGVTAALRTFGGGGQTYGTLTYTVVGATGQLTISGSPVFSTVNVGSGRTLAISSGSVLQVINFNVNGSSINSTVAGTPATISLVSPSVQVTRNNTVKDIAVTPKGHLYALESTDSGGNDGVSFEPFGWGIAA